ncbi:hydrogenase maturation protein HypF [Clostridium pascui]|uniref:carbamoyltransferase HypF n=1 Tax=Clostridium pascui TaxID=46609 RepID=UPI00195EEC58|nr:carbamoyltransferase HypF [Clostridium pascui]MBM7870432.1 hydrogenase maturation protein HypF [Clostridium pascui]
MKEVIRKYITVKGVVQGVGFRPFVYKLAQDNNLNGWVNNSSRGVYIDIEGQKNNVLCFIQKLKDSPPSLSKIDEISVEDRENIYYKGFEIRDSKEEENAITYISPDIGICEDCLRDIMDSQNKRYRYAFTNCTNCGPRFSIIKKLPYDRVVTTMDEFQMCDACYEEYTNPLNRRFHAQPNACIECGPKLELINNKGERIYLGDEVKETIKLIKEGKIIAIKGIGGFHLVCDGKNEEAIKLLRDRKNRPKKPLALMIKDVETVKNHCYLSEKEESTLKDNKRSIVLLSKREENLPINIAPNNKCFGVMLPYTPLHYLLFEYDIEVLVMTSANAAGLPMIYRNSEALDKLRNIADYFLLHNRDIHMPVDDSIVKVILNEERVIRSSRGYAPIYIKQKGIRDILACGSQLKNTFALSKNENIIVSPYIGDMENIETYDNFEKNVEHIKCIYNIKPKIIAYDMHPSYWCREYVENQNTINMEVQHHHAHIVSCMVENNIKEKVIGIAYDGVGYGTDGTIWGGEFIICDYKDFKRIAHLNYAQMPGGDTATKEPWKMAVSYIYEAYKNSESRALISNEDILSTKNYVEDINSIQKNIPKVLKDNNIKSIITMIKNNINSPKCSSMGRLFDAVSGMLGFLGKVTFEGEAAIFLENIADKNEQGSYDYEIIYQDKDYIINTSKAIQEIIQDINNGVGLDIISKRFHNTVIDFTVKMCSILREALNINKVVLSGGVFQNEIILKGVYEKLNYKDFEVYTHKSIPCNDSGICLGQIVIANSKFREE